MQLSHVFIAFLAHEEWFPHGFIAFSLLIFPGVSKCVLRSIFEAFGSPLGSLRGSFGPTFALWGPSWHPFGDHFGFLGRPVALSWLSWDDFGRNFDGFHVQTKLRS